MTCSAGIHRTPHAPLANASRMENERMIGTITLWRVRGNHQVLN
jgi:hypothetical protein